MAEGKKSFVLYCDMLHTVELLEDALAGKLLKHLLRYVNDENPETDDVLLKVAFEPIKRQLKRDLKDWEDIRQKRAKYGKLGGIKSGKSRNKKQNEAKASKLKQRQANEAVNVNGNVTVNVNKRDTMDNSHDIKNSNLFKQPKIPTKQQVLEAIVNAGGNKEMAKSFYEKYESTGWFLNGSPVVNYIILAERFVTNWKKNDKKEEPQQTAPTLRTLPNHGI